MKVKIYIDWENQKVLRETDKKEWIAEYTASSLESDFDLEAYLDDIIDQKQQYAKAYLFRATEEERKEILDSLKKLIFANAEKDFLYEYEEIEIEI